MKIVILDGYGANPGDLSYDGFRRFGELEVYDYTAPEDTAARMAGADAVLTNKTVLTAELINGAASLKYIGILATGYNVVDIKAAAARGIPVCNVPAYSTAAVAQHVFALLLEITNMVGHHNEAVHAGRWVSSPNFCFWDGALTELSGKTMGIIGYGAIGQATAKIAEAMGMRVVVTSRTMKPGMVSLDELLAQSDVISLHCPLFAENAGMINAEAIAKMKDGVIIINTARGGLVNEKDLRAALDSGKVRAIGADVISAEPMKADNPLLGAKNAVLTPHIAWAPTDTRKRLIGIAENNLQSFLNGQTTNNVAF